MVPDFNNPLTSPFWLAARMNKLVICTCKECGQDIWYPKKKCPECNTKSTWRQLSGKATLLSWTTCDIRINSMFNRSFSPAIVIPTDASSVQLVTQVIIKDDQLPRCDMSLQVDFIEIKTLEDENFFAPIFVPA